MIYRKQGQVVRWENGTLIRVTESGAAREDGDFFECWPMGPIRPMAPIGPIGPMSPMGPVERLIVTRGLAHHQYGDRTWSEETRRFHAALVRGRLRALVDREEDLPPIASALARVGEECEAPRHLRLAPNVTAAVLPFLPQAKQTAGGVDGYGEPVTGTSRSFYRPSYRMRPVRMPFNLRLEHENTAIDEDLPRAVALLEHPAGTRLRVLIEEKRRVYPGTIEVTNVRAVAKERVWYPYGAGSFGAEMML